MGTSVYTGTALSGLVELPAVLLIYPAIESRGRRTGVIAFLALAGTFCLGWADYLYGGDKRLLSYCRYVAGSRSCPSP